MSNAVRIQVRTAKVSVEVPYKAGGGRKISDPKPAASEVDLRIKLGRQRDSEADPVRDSGREQFGNLNQPLSLAVKLHASLGRGWETNDYRLPVYRGDQIRYNLLPANLLDNVCKVDS